MNPNEQPHQTLRELRWVLFYGTCERQLELERPKAGASLAGQLKEEPFAIRNLYILVVLDYLRAFIAFIFIS